MAAVTEQSGAHSKQDDCLLGALGDPAAIPARQIALVVAHPDDETIGCGVLLSRLRGRDVTVIVVTDGAPRDGADARQHGFPSVAAYASKRADELRAALGSAGIAAASIVGLGVADQTAALQLPALTRTIYRLFSARNIRIALTHAYEGGHPDHDATAFAVHAAAGLLRRQGHALSIIEMPLYRAGPTGWITQDFFANSNEPEFTLVPTEAERALKRAMLESHATQAGVLSSFTAQTERFRAAPPYDFRVLPSAGLLLYERYAWGMNGQRWLDLTTAALQALGLEGSCGNRPWR